MLQGENMSTATCSIFVRDFGKLQLNISNDAYWSFPEEVVFYPALLQTKAHINWGVLFEYSMYYNYGSHSSGKHDIKQSLN